MRVTIITDKVTKRIDKSRRIFREKEDSCGFTKHEDA